MPSSSQRVEMGVFSRRCRLRMATFSGAEKCRRGLFMRNLRTGKANPNGGFFQFQLRQNKGVKDLGKRKVGKVTRNLLGGNPQAPVFHDSPHGGARTFNDGLPTQDAIV